MTLDHRFYVIKGFHNSIPCFLRQGGGLKRGEDEFCISDSARGGFRLEGIEHVFFKGDVEDGAETVFFDEIGAEGGFVGGKIAASFVSIRGM